MFKIVICVPYDGAEKLIPVWANDEDRINFRTEQMEAARCTLSFAAVELKSYLARTVDESDISFSSVNSGDGFFICLTALDQSGKKDSFVLEPLSNGLAIRGAGRTGVLYGAYEFLRMQGWRWLAPGIEGEIFAPKSGNLKIPESIATFIPSFSLGRGFIFECVSRESADMLVWMARNRMNISGYRHSTGPLGEKLGMSPAIGGHIFEPVLHPDRILPSGRSIWEEHPEWYGLPPGGERRKDAARNTQFCVSQDSLMEFLGDELIGYLKDKWRHADRVDVWGFDTWGSICHCHDCKNIGNGSDQTLHFVSRPRSRIDLARTRGELDHDVKMVICAYEGTSTIDGPVNRVPSNLVTAGDYITFYPIKRCYAHDFTDVSCSWNRAYCESLKSWVKAKPEIPVMIGEYYNVSKFEDLPMLFTNRIVSDIPAYRKMGCLGMTYMHVPLVNWAMRTLTQVLYAQVSWDVTTDVPLFLDEYFQLWYGPHATSMRQAYELLEEAWKHSGQWRNWGNASVLTQLMNWDGGRPEKALTGNDHLTAGNIVSSGRRSIALMEEAMKIIRSAVLVEQKRLSAEGKNPVGIGVNPVAQREMEMQFPMYEKRMGEDRRLLLYGLDVMAIMTEAVAYHDALFDRDTARAEQAWTNLERFEDRLDSYYIPINYEEPGAGLISRDALTRSQLRDCIRRCRRQREIL